MARYDEPQYPYRSYPPPRPRQSLAGVILALLALVFIVAVLLWRFWPGSTIHSIGGTDPNVELRPISPRGDLEALESSVIRLYKQTAPSVVHVTTLVNRRDRFSLNIMRIPKGSGSGFIWDNKGRIV